MKAKVIFYTIIGLIVIILILTALFFGYFREVEEASEVRLSPADVSENYLDDIFQANRDGFINPNQAPLQIGEYLSSDSEIGAIDLDCLANKEIVEYLLKRQEVAAETAFVSANVEIEGGEGYEIEIELTKDGELWKIKEASCFSGE